MPHPAYLNMVRHPINRVQSDYYYLIDASSRPKGRAEEEIERRRASRCGCYGLTFSQCVLSVRFECTENLSLGDELLQYFCGDEDVCRANTEATYRQARRNLDSYVFVGLTEHFMISLQVLERLLPAFFRDARRAFERGAAASAGRGMSVGTATRAKMTAPYEDLSWSAARLLLEHPQNRWELQLWRDIETRFWQTVAGCGVSSATWVGCGRKRTSH